MPWYDFWLNPRRLRGSDFLIRWSQGAWSEERIVEAIAATAQFFALPYGPSGTAPQDIREREQYFDRLEKAGLGNIKRPDLLVFRKSDEESVNDILRKLGGLQELPFQPEDDPEMQRLLKLAFLGIECESSLWKCRKMPDFQAPLTPQRRLGGRLGLKKTAIAPTIILKEEDREPLKRWQQSYGIPVHIWHAFYDLVFGIAFDEVERLIDEGLIGLTMQRFQSPSGPQTSKRIYKINYQHGYLVGEFVEEPILIADYLEDKNGHILPFVRFQGGRLQLHQGALLVLEESSLRRRVS